jgi:hypothetical protein
MPRPDDDLPPAGAGRAARPHPKPAPRASRTPQPRDLTMTGFDRGGASPREKDMAEGLAIRALGFLAADDERLQGFLSLSGLAPETLRQAAAAPGFLASVLDHLAGDEPALLTFAAEAGVDPARVERARAILAGPVFETP